jgi:hypothetical protein
MHTWTLTLKCTYKHALTHSHTAMKMEALVPKNARRTHWEISAEIRFLCLPCVGEYYMVH